MSDEKAEATQKIAINKCHGGFGLSDAAFVEFMRRKGKQIFVEDGVLGSNYWLTPVGEQPKILRQEFYNVPKDKRAEYDAAYEAAGPVSQYDEIRADEKRADPDLIAVIEQFGKDASGKYGNVGVVEIPAGVEWTIEEYDGLEWVAEQHHTWS